MQVVTYYVRCAKTNNHTVREAACNCLAELFVKVDSNAVEPRLPKIQRTLFRCLKDDSWTVRIPLPLVCVSAEDFFGKSAWREDLRRERNRSKTVSKEYTLICAQSFACEITLKTFCRNACSLLD